MRGRESHLVWAADTTTVMMPHHVCSAPHSSVTPLSASLSLVVIRSLVDKGLSVDRCDYDNRSALMISCHEGHAKVRGGERGGPTS